MITYMKMIYLCLLLLLLAPLAAVPPLSPEEQKEIMHSIEAPSEQGTSFFYQLLNMAFALAVVLGLLFVVTYLLRRATRGRQTQMNAASPIKVLEERPLSHKTTLYILELYDKHILVAESQTGIERLAEFEVKDE